MPRGPFPARADAPWAELNQVKDLCGKDTTFEAGVLTESPLELSEEIRSGDLATAPQAVDLLIVGAGLSGAVLAERCSKELGMTSLIIDKRDHLGGNCYDYVERGIRASKYGAHLFHTNSERVWNYVMQFSEWIPFDHRVRGRVHDQDGVEKVVPIPPVQATVNALFHENISTEEEMQAWYDRQRVPLLYEVFWATSSTGIQQQPKVWALLLQSDQWQALPRRGYTRIFENMLLRDPNITVRVNVDFFVEREAKRLPKYRMLVYTGPIDLYFAQAGMPKLEYRSLHFEEAYLEEPEEGFFQEAMVVNYPSPDVPFTRIVEYKHMGNQTEAVKRGDVRGTLIAKETSSDVGEPYYPVPTKDNQALYERYRILAEAESEVCFVGRLASYKYFNMDQAILNALEIYDSLKETGRLCPRRRPEDFGPGDGPK